MLILDLDTTSPVPAYRQIVARVVQLIETGALNAGDRLPPTRTLARIAGVHRSTVLRAYGELVALGHVESRPGSYSTVRRRARVVAATRSPSDSAIDWGAIAPASVPSLSAGTGWTPPPRTSGREVIDFAMLSADPALVPVDDLRRCLKTILAGRGRALLDYGDPAGHAGLREALARRMRVHGIDIASDEVLVTNGAQQALDLVLRLLTAASGQVVVESPTYAAALALFRLQRLGIEAIPMRPDGMDLDVLAAALERRRPSFVYTMPSFQNPTGITTSQVHRERLLGLCEAYAVPLVEDGFEEDLKYLGKAVLPIKSMDNRGVVIYVGTLSKVVFPGLRIGWIAAPEACLQRLLAVHRLSSLGGSQLAQAAIARFCELGMYDAHLRRIHARYRRRMQAMLHGLAAHMPDGAQWTQPAGGCTLLLTLAGMPAGEDAICRRFFDDGVRVEPGRPFFATPPAEPTFRMSIACADEQTIAEGCRRMGQSLRTLIGSQQ